MDEKQSCVPDIMQRRESAMARINERLNPTPKIRALTTYEHTLLEIILKHKHLTTQELYEKLTQRRAGCYLSPSAYRNSMRRLVSEGHVQATGEYQKREYTALENEKGR